MMITYLKHIGKYTHQQLKNKNFEEVQKLYEREKKWIDNFKPMDDSSSKPAGGSRKKTLSRKRAGEKQSQESAKRQKLENATEELESTKSDEEAAADYEQEKEELRMWLTVVLDEEETVDPEILSAKQDLVDLHKLVMKKFEDSTPEGYNLLLWGDLKIMFEPNAEDAIWSNQQDWTLIS
ncbi:hypothetical protein Tco_0630606 [Tanacetum coccineum]